MVMRPGAGQPIKTTPAIQLRQVKNPLAEVISAPEEVIQKSVAVNVTSQPSAQQSGGITQIPFEFGSTALGGATLALIDQIAAAAKKGPTEVILVARDNENWDASKRDGLTNQRISALTSALANRGVSPAAISLIWRPDAADTSIHRDGPGLQEIAKLRISG
jgi:outer membrane protein OmpA-like peptidoglycan-associated protein